MLPGSLVKISDWPQLVSEIKHQPRHSFFQACKLWTNVQLYQTREYIFGILAFLCAVLTSIS